MNDRIPVPRSPAPVAPPRRRAAGQPRPELGRAHPVVAARIRMESLLVCGAIDQATYQRRLSDLDWLASVAALAGGHAP